MPVPPAQETTSVAKAIPDPAPAQIEARPGIVQQGFYSLAYDASTGKWYECKEPTWDTKGVKCGSLEDFTTSLPTLTVSRGDNGKSVNIHRFDGQQMVNYVYLIDGPAGAGFYIATMNPLTGKYISTGRKYVPVAKKKGVDMNNVLSVQYNQTSSGGRP